MLLSLLLLSQIAAAGEEACLECCRREGLAGCPTRARIYGEGSELVPEGGAWRVIGLWWLDCADGARFDPGATAVLPEPPEPGDVLRLASPATAVRCFTMSCGLPADACIFEEGGEFSLLRCQDHQPLSALEMTRRPRVASPAPPRPPAAAVVRAPPVRSDAPITGLPADFALPPPPPASCDSAPTLQAESRRKVGQGDLARVSGDLEGAARDYTAAARLDACNAHAWVGLGLTALAGDRLGDAALALELATDQMPQHWLAWTALGEALERQGQPRSAAIAYARALGLQPGHAPAAAGLRRTQDSVP